MKLLAIDPNFTSTSPSVRAWVAAFPAFSGLFESVEIWTSDCDIPESAGVTVRIFPKRFRSVLTGMAFNRDIRRALSDRGKRDDEIVQITGFGGGDIDIRLIQFSHLLMSREISKRKLRDHFSWKNRFFSDLEARKELRVLKRWGATGHWLVVSRFLGRKLRWMDCNESTLDIVPNRHDSARFHRGLTASHRAAMRKHYGIEDGEIVLGFSAFGHFERKGLRLACQAVSILREKGLPVRFLILGGTESHIAAFRTTLHRRGIGEDGLIWAGLVEGIEKHLSAADAFLFPSHFEAFSLAEIEAAALGLRLYLTRHYGAEMIMREPVNGRYVPWEPEGMADVLSDDIQSGLITETHAEMGEALNTVEFEEQMSDFYRKMIRLRQERF